MTTDSPALKMVQRQVTDPQSGMVAYTYLVPEGWTINDGVGWDYSNMLQPAYFYSSCYNNNGLTVQIHANVHGRYWQNAMGNSGTMRPPGSITEALQWRMREVRKTAIGFSNQQIISNYDQPQPAFLPGATSHYLQQYGMVQGRYLHNNYVFDEIWYGTLLATRLYNPPNWTGFFSDDTTWQLSDQVSISVSGNEQLQTGQAVAMSIKSSLRPTLQFYNCEQQVIKILQNSARESIRSAGEVSKIISETNNYISDTINKSYWERQKTNDKMHEQFCDYIRDIDRYTDGKGYEYQLPSGYQDAWINDKGEVLLTDANTPDPNGIYSTGYWTKMERKKYS
jgi:hypothetical protein